MLPLRKLFSFGTVDTALAMLGLALLLSIMPGTVDNPGTPPQPQMAASVKEAANPAEPAPSPKPEDVRQDTADASSNTETEQPADPAPPAAAPFRIGILAPAGDTRYAARLEPFRTHLAARLGREVKIFTMPDWRTLIAAHARHAIDYAIYGATTYAEAWARCRCIEPLAVARSADGSIGYFAILVVNTDSGIGSLADMAGRSLVFGGDRSIAGHLFPLVEFANAGINPTRHFGSLSVSGNPVDAVRSVIAGEADGALAWSSLKGAAGEGFGRGTLRFLVDHDGLDMSRVAVIWKSRLIPNGPHAIHSAVPAALRDRLQRILVDLAADNPEAHAAVAGDGSGFTAISHAPYAPLLKLVPRSDRIPAMAKSG